MAAFRSLTILPLAFALLSTIIKGLTVEGIIQLPFEIYPFLTSKPPLVYVIFISMSLWIKNREKIYLKMGLSKKEYMEYLNTNKNSLAFSIHTSILFLIIPIIDLICVVLFPSLMFFEFGSCVGLFFAIPFIMLFSYTKTHDNNDFDIILPMAGAGLILLSCVEAIFQLITYII